MNLRWIGAALIFLGCGGVGFSMAVQYRKEMKMLRNLEDLLSFMICELEYRMTSLPELLRNGCAYVNGELKGVLQSFSEELDTHCDARADLCLAKAMKKAPNLPGRVQTILEELVSGLGKFDLSGQIRTLESIRTRCNRELTQMEADRVQQTRSYQTLGLCAGAALAVLFI